MVNLIGAYIVTIFLLGLCFQRPSLLRAEEVLKKAPLFIHLVIVFVFVSLALQQSLNLFHSVTVISIADTILYNLNLWIHEAGHVYFNWGWEFLHFLGGTLNEIILPFLGASYCWIRGYRFLCSMFIFWFGHSCFGIGRYIADARAKTMPLLGVGSEGHDWAYILGRLNILEFDKTLGSIVWYCGWLSVLVSLAVYLASMRSKIKANR